MKERNVKVRDVKERNTKVHGTKERNVKEKEEKEKLLQWHSAFYAGIQIELSEEADKLEFEREHNLGTKPMLIDVLVIKKHSEDKIKKNIGNIFRKYNIVEYKSPKDYLSIDDFYKVYGYCCFYKSQAKKLDEIKAEELTITFVSYHYPRKFFKHLKEKRDIQMEVYDKGIYYLAGDVIPMQVIVTSRLSQESNLWLRHLTNRLKREEVSDLVREYQKYRNEPLHKSMMELIVQANSGAFKEENNMCEALKELFKEELQQIIEEEVEERVEKRVEEAVEQNNIKLQQEIERERGNLICNALQNGHTPEQIREFIGISLEEILKVQMSLEQGKN